MLLFLIPTLSGDIAAVGVVLTIFFFEDILLYVLILYAQIPMMIRRAITIILPIVTLYKLDRNLYVFILSF